MKLFKTRSFANEGIKVPLADPRTGEDTEFYLIVRGIDSDEVRSAKLKANRLYLAAASLEYSSEEEKDKQLQAVLENNKSEVLASIVKDWNFVEDDGTTPVPCTPQAVKDFLREAPQIADAINTLCMERERFLPPSSADSTAGQNESSN